MGGHIMTKPRNRHMTTVGSYSYWADRFGRVHWEWACNCGARHGGYVTQLAASRGADEHRERAEADAAAEAAKQLRNRVSTPSGLPW